MPRRFNYTNRQKINREDVSIRLRRNGEGLVFDADLRLADYKLDKITPPPQVYVEAYRGASALWKRFDFGRFGTTRPPDDRSLNEFGVPEGILFRVKVSAAGDDTLGRLLAEADRITPRLADEFDSPGQPLIQHVASNEIGDEVWRVDFGGVMPLLKINERVPMGVDQFLRDPQYRAVFAPVVMRQILTRILIIERDAGDEDDETDWRQRWLQFARRLVSENWEIFEPNDGNLQTVEDWIDSAVEEFISRSGLFIAFAQPAPQEGQS
jgi:hypothetical protein